MIKELLLQLLFVCMCLFALGAEMLDLEEGVGQAFAVTGTTATDTGPLV